MNTENEKSVGIRLPIKTYDELHKTCERLGRMSLSRFAHMAIENTLEMLHAEKSECEECEQLLTPKWIAVKRFQLNFNKGDKIKG